MLAIQKIYQKAEFAPMKHLARVWATNAAGGFIFIFYFHRKGYIEGAFNSYEFGQLGFLYFLSSPETFIALKFLTVACTITALELNLRSPITRMAQQNAIVPMKFTPEQMRTFIRGMVIAISIIVIPNLGQEFLALTFVGALSSCWASTLGYNNKTFEEVKAIYDKRTKKTILPWTSSSSP